MWKRVCAQRDFHFPHPSLLPCVCQVSVWWVLVPFPLSPPPLASPLFVPCSWESCIICLSPLFVLCIRTVAARHPTPHPSCLLPGNGCAADPTLFPPSTLFPIHERGTLGLKNCRCIWRTVTFDNTLNLWQAALSRPSIYIYTLNAYARHYTDFFLCFTFPSLCLIPSVMC